MGHTYGESWAFFFDNGSTPNVARHQTRDTADLGNKLQGTSAVRVARSQVAEQITPSSVAILAEIQRLQRELHETRSHYRSSSIGSQPVCHTNSAPRRPGRTPVRPAQDRQQSSAPNDQPIDSDDRSTAELPRCWDACCNGRTFSNNSNLARHQREKRGCNAKLKCLFCGTGFSRSSARNAHEAERRCRNVGGDVVD